MLSTVGVVECKPATLNILIRSQKMLNPVNRFSIRYGSGTARTNLPISVNVIQPVSNRFK